MRTYRLATILALVAALAPLGAAQCNPLAVNTAGGNGQNGYMFDIDNISGGPVTVTGFGVFGLAAAATQVEIRTLLVPGGFNANPLNLTTAANWSAPVTAPVNLLTTLVQLPHALSVVIPPGTTQAFYITAIVGANLSYTTGTGVAPLSLGGIIAADANIQVRGGVGKAYPFLGTFGLPTAGRLFRGSVSYSTGGPSLWETNSPPSDLTFNGVNGNPCAKAETVLCDGQQANVVLATSLAGSPFELAYNLVPTVANGAGGFQTLGGQIVNMDLGGGLFFLNGGTGLLFLPHPGLIPLSFAMPGGLIISAQQIVVDPTHPDGLQLSQAAQLTGLIAPYPVTVPGPVGDDTAVLINMGVGPNCLPSADFYGQAVTQIQFVSNARVTMGSTVNTSFTPTVAAAMVGAGSAGGWMDLNPALGGTCDFSYGDLAVLDPNLQLFLYPGFPGTRAFCWRWFNVPLFGFPTWPVHYRLYLVFGHAPGGGFFYRWIWRCFISPFGSPFLGNQFVGISPGTGATDPGVAAFSNGGSGFTSLPTDMLYNFGVPATTDLLGGANTIEFSPLAGSSANGYGWAGFNIP